MRRGFFWTALLFAGLFALAVRAQVPGFFGVGREMAQPVVVPPDHATAIFAGGCFWCMERDFESLAGVVEVESGYTAGHTAHPDYESVSDGRTGHAEAVRVIYDPARVSYAQLLDFFWRHIDPTAKDRQFCDTGTPYRSGIYWQNDEERNLATRSRDALLASGRFREIHTELAPASSFWIAEGFHQDYYKKNPLRYGYYRFACGRDARVAELWGESQAQRGRE